MSQHEDFMRVELHIYSSKKDVSIIELLIALAFYHRVTSKIGLNHTVYFGCPWQSNSICDFGFVSLPYINGPALEDFNGTNRLIKFYWLLPVTESEVKYKKEVGVEALESRFYEPAFNYTDPNRPSVV